MVCSVLHGTSIHWVEWRKEKCSQYGSPTLGLEYPSEYRLGFFHCINCFFNIPLEAFWFLSWQSRALAILQNLPCGQRPKVWLLQSWECQCRSLAWGELLLRKSIACSGSRSDSPLSLTDTLCNNIPEVHLTFWSLNYGWHRWRGRMSSALEAR